MDVDCIQFGLICINDGWLRLPTYVSSQQPIVNQLEYPPGDTFNITCDVSRFADLRSAGELLSISLLRQLSTQTSFENIASYEPKAEKKMTTNIPIQWQVFYAGGEGINNRNTIRLVVTVVDFQCADAGLYQCQIFIPAPSHQANTTPVNITAKIGITQKDIYMTPHKKIIGEDIHSSVNTVGVEITLTCSFTGPANLQALWRRKKAGHEENYPYANNIKNSKPVFSVISGCNTYDYTSELKCTLEEKDNGTLYICVVMEDNIERSRKMFTNICSEQSTNNISPSKPGSRPDSAGSNVGTRVFGLLVVLVIIVVLIYFFVIQKNKQIESPEVKLLKYCKD
ncbi:uncharacterized protein LOC106071327 isoform X5 [Biomphalaria glabrata]|uniref:Uncharacterized protein LOC106071327 isoform X5 n=1 Tax=Biomphalaria glabrata TaxID=6526 RepID=A0A9W2YU05_BIOGL|nr:uncharacterized protein LOC106071327 isoform X5 [Biomphalaria glabrata]